jgi:tRNA/tmRNA/rRNA uracil-C5-methylase (TrmA/RlmC/RlmD family)
MIAAGTALTLDIEKPTAGGRMLARHHGQVVLVWGGIPGERVAARVERSGKGVVYAEAIDILAPSPDRRSGAGEWRCGGNVFMHIAYPRQLQLKAEIIQDAFGRIGHVPLPAAPDMIGSPEHGYRMRARLHADGDRLGFFRDGTHQLCDAAVTTQLLPATNEWLSEAEGVLRKNRLRGLVGLELAEDIAGSARACHLELEAGVDPSPFAALAAGLTGLSAQTAGRRAVTVLAGTPSITDTLPAGAAPAGAVTLRRDVRAFFQGNRFLLEPLLRHVISMVPAGPVVDLYAGVGLFGLSLAAAGTSPVTLVEGDPVSGADLEINAAPFADRVRVERSSVEGFLGVDVAAPRTAPPGRGADGRNRSDRQQGAERLTIRRRGAAIVPDATVIVDPPRTGMSKEALAGIVQARPQRLVYVSCDVATLARDTRILLDAGYELDGVTGMDLFPNTAHVETIASFTR